MKNELLTKELKVLLEKAEKGEIDRVFVLGFKREKREFLASYLGIGAYEASFTSAFAQKIAANAIDKLEDAGRFEGFMEVAIKVPSKDRKE